MSWFGFRQFVLRQAEGVHRLGTDAMLLGAWTRCEGAGQLLDVGTGTGVLALMLAQRAQRARLDAIDPEPPAVAQARANVAASPWAGRIRVHQARLQDWRPQQSYDLIVCNPPYFSETTRAHGQARQRARHTDDLSHAELLEHSLRLLGPAGRLSLVLPLAPAQKLLADSPLYLRRRCLVRHSARHHPSRMLLEFGREPAEPEVAELLLRTETGAFSAAYLQLTQIYHTPRPPADFRRGQPAP